MCRSALRQRGRRSSFSRVVLFRFEGASANSALSGCSQLSLASRTQDMPLGATVVMLLAPFGVPWFLSVPELSPGGSHGHLRPHSYSYTCAVPYSVRSGFSLREQVDHLAPGSEERVEGREMQHLSATGQQYRVTGPMDPASNNAGLGTCMGQPLGSWE